MKRVFAAVAILILLGSMAFTAELSWRSSWPRAVAEAKKSGKNLMVFIEAKHCPYCERMKAEVLSDPDVIRSLKDFVPVLLEIDDPVVRREFPTTSVTPTIYFVTPQKELLMDIVGYLNTEFFFWRLSAAEREAERLKKSTDSLNPDN